jgi:hypothetical protein
MGIRFICPNGHKLNVKAFLAGKRGLCPKCGAKVVIPPHSTRRSRKSPPPDPPAEVPAEDGSPTELAPFEPFWPVTEAMPHTADEPSEVSPPALPDRSDPPIFEEFDFNALEASPAPNTPVRRRLASGPSDPAAEVAWYVQLPSGGQFGPASGEVIRSWIEEGRVPHDSMVWHEGWRDWQVAAKAFPQMAAQREQDQLQAIVPRRPLWPIAAPTAQRTRKRSSTSRTALLTIMLVVIALMMLAGALIWVRFAA